MPRSRSTSDLHLDAVGSQVGAVEHVALHRVPARGQVGPDADRCGTSRRVRPVERAQPAA